MTLLRTLAVVCVLLASSGCVERTITINTTPDGSLVYLNDKEVGRTPVTVPFEWYGDYDVVIRKDGYDTLKTHRKLNAPWYQYPPFDFFAEILTPATIRDDRSWEFELDKAEPVVREELIDRAKEVRREAGGEQTSDE